MLYKKGKARLWRLQVQIVAVTVENSARSIAFAELFKQKKMALIKTNPIAAFDAYLAVNATPAVNAAPDAALDADDLTKIIADNVHYVK